MVQFSPGADTDPAIVAGMERGRELARTGALQDRAHEMADEHSSRAARAGQLKASGSQLGQARADRYRAERAARAAGLGFETLEGYYARRYVEDGARLADLQQELGADYSAVRSDLRRCSIPARRGRRPIPRSN